MELPTSNIGYRLSHQLYKPNKPNKLKELNKLNKQGMWKSITVCQHNQDDKIACMLLNCMLTVIKELKQLPGLKLNPSEPPEYIT